MQTRCISLAFHDMGCIGHLKLLNKALIMQYAQ